MKMLLNILLLSAAIFVVAKILPGVRLKSFATAIIVAIVYSIINFLLFGIIAFLTLPATILTLGLFIFVINAFLLWLTDKFIEDFEIDGIFTTLIAAFLITVINNILKWIF
ncbi:MAG: phage holin family protein [bacterium]